MCDILPKANFTPSRSLNLLPVLLLHFPSELKALGNRTGGRVDAGA